MSRHNYALLRRTLVLFVLLAARSAVAVNTETGKKCTISSLSEGACNENETCSVASNADEGYCECIPGFVRKGGLCEKSLPIIPKPQDTPASDPVNPSKGHSIIWTLFALISIGAVIVGIYVSYKLQLVSWLKYKVNQRYNRNYDDVMIGQDDE